MHRIETFSPDMGSIKDMPDHDLEKKMVSSDVISQADVKKYADYIIDELKLLKNSSEKKAFVIDALSDTKILNEAEVKKEIFKGNLDFDEAEGVIKRVRQALIEQLKGKIDEKIYLVIKNIKKVKASPSSGRENIINQLIDTDSGREKIYKNQGHLGEEHAREMPEAFAVLNKLPPHPNVVSIKDYDPTNQRTIYEKLKMHSLKEFLGFSDRSRKDFLISLKILKDCLVGGVYLAENGLVLQDIKLDNLGLVMEEKSAKGVLFDLEGLVKEGTQKGDRLYSKGYRPPLKDLLNEEGVIKAGEMVYQFGVCLQEILKLYEDNPAFEISDSKAAKKLEDLSKKMIEPDPENRIGLPEAKAELEAIVSKFEIFWRKL
ncbi:MAG: hypothetical protein G01um101413_444 [Parcubacteria group bacterium Gr01-1014_13]|nr:MAG: hypothetical protein G01um101413_444 [Parcubacteria group bacterium Gr01-1014_13]